MEKKKNILDDIKKSENPFMVPDGYFQDFSLNLEQKISTIEKEKTKKLFTIKYSPWLYIAASFLLLFLCTKSIIKTSIEDDLTSKNIDIQSTEVDQVLFSYIDDDLMIIDYLVSENSEQIR